MNKVYKEYSTQSYKFLILEDFHGKAILVQQFLELYITILSKQYSD